jgi:hypothetical protein
MAIAPPLDPEVRELLEAIHGMLDTPLPASLVEAWKARDRTLVVLAAAESVLDPANHVTAKDAARYLRDRLDEVERAATPPAGGS